MTRYPLAALLTAALLASCAEEDPTTAAAWDEADALPADAAGPPALTLTHTPFVLGQPVTMTVTGARAGDTVRFVRGARVAPSATCPAAIAPNCVDLASPIVVQFTARANNQGVATVTFALPPQLPVTEAAWQAASYHNGLLDKSTARTIPILDPNGDPDADGLTSGEEVALYGTDPLVLDSDGGGYSDGLEVTRGTDPLTAGDDGPVRAITLAAHGDLVVTEIMKDPDALPDGAGEWVEIYNASGAPIDLNGMNLSDDGNNNAPIGVSRVIAAGAYAVLAVDGNLQTNGGVGVLYAWMGQAFFLDNGDDEVVLEKPNGDVIDRVVYDAGLLWPDPMGASLSLDPSVRDAVGNDAPAAWCVSPAAPFGLGDLGSPGLPNPACP
jgi:hypothetical protein